MPFRCQLPQTKANIEKFFEAFEKFVGTVKVAILCDAHIYIHTYICHI